MEFLTGLPLSLSSVFNLALGLLIPAMVARVHFSETPVLSAEKTEISQEAPESDSNFIRFCYGWALWALLCLVYVVRCDWLQPRVRLMLVLALGSAILQAGLLLTDYYVHSASPQSSIHKEQPSREESLLEKLIFGLLCGGVGVLQIRGALIAHELVPPLDY